MFASKLIFVLAMIYSIAILVNSNADSEGNIHLFKNEISKAMENCGETKEVRDAVREEYDQRVSNPSVHRLYRRDSRYTNNEDKTLRDSESGDWDDEENNRTKGKSWNDPKDDKFIIDSIYSHDRRNDSYGTNNFSHSNNRSQNDQNTTKLGQGYSENNFDSRGGRLLPGLSILNENREPRSIKRHNSIKNPTEIIFSLIRKKRETALIKSASANECLSQCVFRNLQIVDDRGIPKEVMFIKLVQDTVTSQQSKSLIQKLIQSCFRELISESEENGCSYSNSLERCLNLQLKKRKDMENEENK